MTFRVQQRMCASCIYRPDSSLDIEKLEADVADPKMRGFFRAYRECHHAQRGSGICCRGFWEAHKDDFTAGQLAQRLNMIEFVDEDAAEYGEGRSHDEVGKSVRQSQRRLSHGSS